jgi:hypothetical protein
MNFKDVEPCRDDLHDSLNDQDSVMYEPLLGNNDSTKEVEESQYFADDETKW